jgi:hypothetical protein
MNENDSQHELADELLSAYLDDELSPVERAAVESRLSNDPTAQQTLHQLRSVSQSIQRLPLESVGADVREKILDRIQGLESSVQPKAAADGQPSPGGGELPKITIFNSRRSWIWASLAVAAGLMIMFLSPSEEKNKQLPAIAKNDTADARKRRLEESTPSATRGPSEEFFARNMTLPDADKPAPPTARTPAVPSVPPPAPAPVSVATAVPAPPAVKLEERSQAADKQTTSDELATRPMTPAAKVPPQTTLTTSGGGAERKALGGAMAVGRSAAAGAPVAGYGGESKGAPLGSAASAIAARESLTAADSLVVVHVLAKPTAIQNRAFDKLLISNGISLEAETVGNEVADAAKVSPALESESAARQFGNMKAAQHTDEVDMVLVDAPESAVKSCLADLQKDADNYASVEVEVTPSLDRAKQQKQLEEKEEKVVTGLGQFNRGMIPQQQKENFRNQFYYQSNAQQQLAKSEAAASTEPVINKQYQLNLQDLRRAQQRTQSSDNRGRALRFSQSNADNLPLATSGPMATKAGTPANQSVPLPPAQQNAEPPATKLADSNLQVLFMLSPAEEAAASPPAEKRAE